MFARALSRVVKDPGWNGWAAGGEFVPGGGSSSGPLRASQLLTVYGCVTRIADVMATMPVDHFTRQAGVQREVSPRAPWLDQPNPEMDWQSFMTQVMWSWLMDGNVFLVPIRSEAGRVLEVWVLDPVSVQLQRAAGRPVEAWIGGRRFMGEMLVLRAYTRPGEVRGLNPIENARTAIGLGVSAQEYGGSFLANNAVPPLVIKVKSTLSKAQRDDVRDGWGGTHAGPRNAGKVGILTGDAEIQQLSITPEQAQFLESRRFSAAEISANIFHVPTDMVGVALEGSSLTYQNISDRWDEFIRSACMRWMSHFEKAVSWQLMPRPQFMKFNANVYLRPNTKTRYEAHAIGIKSHFLTPNEARGYEDMTPLEGGDEFPLIAAEPAAAPGGAP